MCDNANQFRQSLKSCNVVLEEGKVDIGTFFAVEDTIPSGPRVRIVALFEADNNQVAILTYNYLSIISTSKKEYILEKLNELNLKYTYIKFVLTESNEIAARLFIAVDNDFNASSVWFALNSIYDALKEEYGNFMNILWR